MEQDSWTRSVKVKMEDNKAMKFHMLFFHQRPYPIYPKRGKWDVVIKPPPPPPPQERVRRGPARGRGMGRTVAGRTDWRDALKFKVPSEEDDMPWVNLKIPAEDPTKEMHQLFSEAHQKAAAEGIPLDPRKEEVEKRKKERQLREFRGKLLAPPPAPEESYETKKERQMWTALLEHMNKSKASNSGGEGTPGSSRQVDPEPSAETPGPSAETR